MRGLGATIAAAALAAAFSPVTHADETRVIWLISSFHHASLVSDRAPKGEVSAGDVVVSFDRLANAAGQFGRPRGAHVGHDRGQFTYLTATRMQLDGWTTLPGGRMHVHGLVRTVRGDVVAINVVGGTGAFSGARGTVTVTPYPTTARTLLVYRVKLG